MFLGLGISSHRDICEGVFYNIMGYFFSNSHTTKYMLWVLIRRGASNEYPQLRGRVCGFTSFCTCTSLIRTFCSPGNILLYPMILFADSKGPD